MTAEALFQFEMRLPGVAHPAGRNDLQLLGRMTIVTIGAGQRFLMGPTGFLYILNDIGMTEHTLIVAQSLPILFRQRLRGCSPSLGSA